MKINHPEVNVTAHIFAPFSVTSPKSNYNVIFGRDLQQGFGINLDFQNNFVGWKESKILIKSFNHQKLAMDLYKSPDIFQEKMNDLFHSFYYTLMSY